MPLPDPTTEELVQALGELGLVLEVPARDILLEGGVQVELVGRCDARVVVVRACPLRGDEALRDILGVLVATRRERVLLARLVQGEPQHPPRVVVILDGAGQDLREQLDLLPVEVFEWRGLRSEQGRHRVLVGGTRAATIELVEAPPDVECPASPEDAAAPTCGLSAFLAEWAARVQRIDPELRPRESDKGLEGRLGDRVLYRVRHEQGGACIELEDVVFHLSSRDPAALADTLQRCLAALVAAYLRQAPHALPLATPAQELDLGRLLATLHALPDEDSDLPQVTLRPWAGPILTPEEYDALRG